jgi:ArsR family transcriptional regulator
VCLPIEICQYRHVSMQRCSPLVGAPLSPDEADGLAGSLKALADPVRLRLLSLIAAHEGGEACVCDIADAFDLAQPTISHHLKVLRTAGLVTSERRGTWVFYRVDPSALQRLSEALRLVGTAHPVPA